jgi:16S rRNA G1207 methylase RsmC
LIKTIVNIILKYKAKIFIVLIFEIIYIFLLRYKGNSLKLLHSKLFTDNIPTPYLFLSKISKFFKNKEIKQMIDVGCGSGRVLYFFSRKNPNIKIDGYELNKCIFADTLKLKNNNKNIKIYNKNVLNEKLKKNYDIFFLADPFKKVSDYNKFFNNILKNKKKIYIVIVNNNKFIISLKKLRILNYYKCNKSGYKIYSN